MHKQFVGKMKIVSFFLLVFAGTILFTTRPAYAIPVEDIPAAIGRAIASVISKSGSQIFNSVLTTAVNQFAYDYATYLGSGAPGQKPFFEQKPLGDRILDAADAGLGQFVEGLAKNGLQYTVTDGEGNTAEKKANLDLCSPDIFTLQRITLGLTEVDQPTFTSGGCSFKQIKESWVSEYEQVSSIIKDKSYLQKVGNYFEPGQSDLAISFELFGEAEEKSAIEAAKVEGKAIENRGWLRVDGIIGERYKDAPGSKERQEQQLRTLQSSGIGKYTGDVFVDAANIFLNQYALTAFNKLMDKIGSLGDENGIAGGDVQNPYAQGSGGSFAVENKLSSIIQARFNERTDYDILGELISCPALNSKGTGLPGPTNCVITDSFSTAISKRTTVIDAINNGYLKGDYSFGYKGLNNEEPTYNQGYPYRSLIILRKYRIIPVGWELAAQFIQKNNKSANPSPRTEDIKLMDLVKCFDPCDDYGGYNDGTNLGQGNCQSANGAESWCEGLVDPNWVLKVPKTYCKAEGYGPEVQNSQYVNQGKFCSKKLDKACVDSCVNLGENFDAATCCQASEGECEAKNLLNVTRLELILVTNVSRSIIPVRLFLVRPEQYHILKIL